MLKLSNDVWFISDTHFGHTNIIKYCNRPYRNTYEMDTDIIIKWNNNIKNNDLVFHLGDFSFRPEKYIGRLNGNIILIKGNHDKRSRNSLFYGVANHLPLMIGEFSCILHHRPITKTGLERKEDELDLEVLENYDFCISGHVHEKYKVNGKNINVGIDVWKKPIHINELIEFMQSLER